MLPSAKAKSSVAMPIMEPFFEWKMKFLPVIISWLQRSPPSRLGTESNKKSASRKLSALYKFVRGMPDLAVLGYWEGRMIHIEAERRRLDYEEDITDEASRNKHIHQEVVLPEVRSNEANN